MSQEDKDQWLALSKRAQELSDDIRETLGQPSVAAAITPDAGLYSSAVATLLNAFSRTIVIDLHEKART